MTEEPLRAHRCLQEEAGTPAGVGVGSDMKWCTRVGGLLSRCRGGCQAWVGFAQSPFPVSRHVAGGGRLPRHRTMQLPRHGEGHLCLRNLGTLRSLQEGVTRTPHLPGWGEGKPEAMGWG